MAKTLVFAVLYALQTVRICQLSLFLACALANTCFAQPVSNHGQVASSQAEAVEQAKRYVEDTKGIGIVFRYGTAFAMLAQSLGDRFVSEIGNRGGDARYFYYEDSTDTVSMLFLMTSEAIGPLSPQEAASNTSKIVERAQTLNRIAVLKERMAISEAKLKEKYGDDFVDGMAREYLQGDEENRVP